MDWQLIAVGLIVAVAVVYLVRRALRSWSGGGGCGTGCGGGCGTEKPAAGGTTVFVSNLTVRRPRK